MHRPSCLIAAVLALAVLAGPSVDGARAQYAWPPAYAGVVPPRPAYDGAGPVGSPYSGTGTARYFPSQESYFQRYGPYYTFPEPRRQLYPLPPGYYTNVDPRLPYYYIYPGSPYYYRVWTPPWYLGYPFPFPLTAEPQQ